MKCNQKHAKYQPTDKDWVCPVCNGKRENGVYVDVWCDGSDDCDLLHDDDELCCYSCDWESTGKAFARFLIKKKSLVPCKCCNGKGFVQKDPT
jgi:hypothetical protein